MFSHLKRRIGVLTAVAVLAALVPTLAVSTVSAAPATTATAAGDTTSLSACPTGAAAAAGFTDTTSTDVGKALVGARTQRGAGLSGHTGQVQSHLPTRNAGRGLIGGRRDTSGDAVHGDAVNVS